MENNDKGYLVIIGGAEDKSGGSVILKKAAGLLYDDELLTIITTATEHPKEAGDKYRRVFSKLGIKRTQVLDIYNRDRANDERVVQKLRNSKCIFFTGGDQLRLTSILGGTRCYLEIKEVYKNGGVVVGTSAGASMMSSVMIVEGGDNEPAKKCTTKMAPGFDLLPDTIIDQHFDQRGRLGRLLCSVAENPDVLGIGIDEDTAIFVYPDMTFEVIGSNTVIVIDGKTIKSSNISELKSRELIAITGVTLHALPAGYGFDLITREVMRLKKDED
jgi:cyanophycinase